MNTTKEDNFDISEFEDLYASRVSGVFCSHDNCFNEAVIEHHCPDDKGFFECEYHLTHMSDFCEECQSIREVVDYKSGPSLGGLGTVEIMIFKCGHQHGEEYDDISLYK